MHELWSEYYVALSDANKEIESLKNQLQAYEQGSNDTEAVDETNPQIQQANQE